MREAFPHVRVDRATRVVEFDARISPMLVPDAKAPRFYLEVVCCAPDSREHETLVVTDAKPSHIHAGLLSVGLAPGHPGVMQRGGPDGTRIDVVEPSGDRVEVRFLYQIAGREVEADPLEWIINARRLDMRFVDEERRKAAGSVRPAPGWVFAGSRLVAREGREVYDADGTGVVIGFTTFGSEVIGWSRVISPDSVVQEPEWIADFARTAPAGTPVKVRVRAPG